MIFRNAFALILTGVLLSPCLLAESLAGKRPNILFILTDDQGYGDLSVHGNPVLKTPHLDRLHSESVRFTDWHNSPTCAPTRSALLTGRHEFQNGVTHTILERERLTLDATTVVELLQGSGYKTGIFGKWHLGDEAEYQPGKRGFQEVFVHGGGGIGQTYPGSCGDAPGNTYFNPAILHNGTFEKTQGYCTDVFFDQATKWIDATKGQQPFLCWVATNAPHSPYQAKPEDAALYRDKTPSEDVANFFGMLHNIDQNVGNLLAKLDEWGIAKDTLVIFMNDNGGTAGVQVYNAGMRGSKGSPWLGGTRACSFWRWPGALTPGDCGALTAHVDFFRTLTSLAGIHLPPKADLQAQGRDLIPLLESPGIAWEERFLVNHLGRWPKGSDPDLAKTQNCSIRSKQFTLVSEAPRGKLRLPAPAQGWQLFDVLKDPAQTTDIAAKHPEIVEKMASFFDQWWNSVQPQMVNESASGPRVNPFKELYWKQFGGGPSKKELEEMDPARISEFGKPRSSPGPAATRTK